MTMASKVTNENGDYPSNHFSSEGAENQACNSPPASDNDCSGYEKSTSNYSQCSGFKYQQLDETIGRPDEHTETTPAPPISPIVVQTERFSKLVVFSILAMFFFLPTGIAAIVHAFKARSAEKRGEIIQAHYHARNVWSLLKVSLTIGIIVHIFNFVVRPLILHMFSSRS